MLVGLNISHSNAHLTKSERKFLEGGIEVLDEHIIEQRGCFKRVRRWLRGTHPHLGKLHHGYTGWETIQEVEVITAMKTFFVNES